MKENSIEEIIKQLELILKVRKEQREIIECAGGSCMNCDPDIKALTESIKIVSDYKRVLKENEEIKSENRRLKVIRYSTEYGTENIHLITKSDLVEINTNKYFIEIQDGKFVDLKQVYQENEELKRDRNNNYQMIALAQNEAVGYMQGYEDGKKLKRSAVACVVENQQYYIIKKEIEHYKEYIEKLQKENEKYKRLSEINLKNAEEFKDNMCEHRCLLKSENEELKKFITEGITVVPHSPYENYRLDFLRENFVSKKKIKNKIEELSKTKGDLATHIAVSERIRALQEILEESEGSKDGEN